MRGLLLFGVLAMTIGLAQAGNIDILGIRSAEYLMELSRNAVTDCADGVTYNPAGLAFIDDGIHMNFSGQYIGKDYTITGTLLGTTSETELSTDKATPFIPNFYAVYKADKLAAFGGFTIPAGGGSVDYTDGLFIMPLLQTVLVQAQFGPTHIAVLNEGSMEGTSVYYRGLGGVAYALTEQFSAALSGRFTSGHRNYKGDGSFTIIDLTTMSPVGTTSAELDVDRAASGFSGVISVDYRPSSRVNLAARYETATELEFVSTANVASTWDAVMPYLADGAKQRRDLPAVAAIGVEMVVNSKFRLGGSGNYYFIEASDQGADDGINDAYKDGWEANISGRYQFNDAFAGALGYSYSNYGGCDSTYTDLEYNLDAGLLSGGINWQANDAIDFTLAGGTTFFSEGEGTGIYTGESYDKKVFFLAAGVNASF
jgi:long-chain fatty acid transport protein